MFTTKKTKLFDKNVAKKAVANAFLNAAGAQTSLTKTDNGAKAYSTTGDEFVDQFGKLSAYKVPRSFTDIQADCEKLWAIDHQTTVKFILYTRMISRKVRLLDNTITDQPQSGAELRYEGVMRMIWLSQKSPEAFWNNVGLFISVGSCKDIITMLRYDLVYNGWDGRVLDWAKFGDLILSLLNNQNTVELMKKYLPQVRATSKCNTIESQANVMVAKWICALVFGPKAANAKTYQQYRKLKNSGTAHVWQQLISQSKFNEIDFDKIHGRALNLLVKSKFLRNQKLQDSFSEWVGEAKEVKYTGFVHELLCDLNTNRDRNFVATVDKQFETAVSKAKAAEENNTKFIVVRDVSGSMSSTALGTKYRSSDIAKSLSIYFSEFLTGTFAGHCIDFNSTPKLNKLNGSTASEKWNSDRVTPSANTNFQGVIDLLVKMKSQGVAEEDFPTGLICLSDGEFDSSGDAMKTNAEMTKTKLLGAGFSPEFVDSFKMVFWDIPNTFFGYARNTTKNKFETYGNVKNVFYMSGYSASCVKFILNQKVETAVDLFQTAMDQEILNRVSL